MKADKIVHEVLLYTRGECHVFNARGELIKELCLPHAETAEKLLKAKVDPHANFGIARDGFGVIPMTRDDFFAPGWKLGLKDEKPEREKVVDGTKPDRADA